MALRTYPSLILFVFLSISYLLVNQYQSAPIVKHPNLNLTNLFPRAESFSSSLINRSQNIVDRFQCVKGWKQFGGSCYYPSIMTSTPDQANKTCSLLHMNNTYLMHIRHPVELSYAAHLFFKNNLTILLVETDPILFKNKMVVSMASVDDQQQWKKIEDKLYHDLTNENDHNNNSFERFKDIRGLCDYFAWNVINNDSHIFTFTSYKIWDKVVCSLSDIDLNTTYEYVCQYVLDFCFGNIVCGKHGQCVNSFQGFKCSCSFFFGGVLCEKFSRLILEMIIGVIIIIILYLLLLILKILDYIWARRNRQQIMSNDRQNGQEIMSNDRKETTENFKINWISIKEKFKTKGSIRLILVNILGFVFFCLLLVIPAVAQLLSFPFRDIDPLKSQSLIDEAVAMLKKCERKSFITMKDWISLGISLILTIILFLSVIINKHESTENHSSSRRRNSNSQLKRKTSSRTKQQKDSIHQKSLDKESQCHESDSLLEGQSSVEIAQPSSDTAQQSTGTVQPSVDTAQQSGGMAQQTGNMVQQSSERTQPSKVIPYNDPTLSYGLLLPIGIYDKCNRYEAASIFGILTYEILKVFDEILLGTSGPSDDGVMTVFVKRMVIVFLIGFRYYPTLMCLHSRNFIVRFLVFDYVLGIIIYTIYRESCCIDFLPHSGNFSVKDEVQLRIQLSTGFIIYGLIANIPHFALLSYIGAEFGMRFMFDSFKRSPENKKKEYVPKPCKETPLSGTDFPDNRSIFQKLCNQIYQEDDNFLYSSMVISTYTVNFIILYHLTCTFSFLYTTRTMSPISFITNIFEQILSIEIKDRVFHVEIIVSAIITASIYSIQLFLGMKNFRKEVTEYRAAGGKRLIDDKGITTKQARSQAIQYPGYLLRYTIGGFVITFHLLIFIGVIPRFIFRYSYAFKWILEFISPLLIFYALQWHMTRMISRFIDINSPTNDKRDTSSTQNIRTRIDRSQWKNNFENILQYFILVSNCFISILSSVIRLLIGILFNILYMNRIDFCLYQKPLEKFDSANTAYWCFVYQEAFPTQHEQRDEQGDDLIKSSSDDETIDNETQQGSEEQGALVPSISATTDPDLQRAFLKNYENLPKQSNSSTEKDVERISKNKDDLKVQHSSYLLKGYNVWKEYFDTKNLSASIICSTEQLATIHLKKSKMPGDGNCFFHAIEDQLWLHNYRKRYFTIRSDAVKYLKRDKNRFKDFIDESEYLTYENYIKQMSQDKSYADYLTLSATAIIVKKNIIVHERGKIPLKIPGYVPHDDQLHVWYDPITKHYDSLVSSNDSKPQVLSPEQVLDTT